MKKLLLASAVAALSITAAQAAPQVYGKAFLTLDLQDGDTDYTNVESTVVTDENGDFVSSNTRTVTGSKSTDGRSKLNSNSSRIGFKGSEALTANTDLVYQLEYGIDVDANEDQFYSRDTFLGLSNKQYGTLLAGRLSAIDGMVDYANVSQGGVLGGNNVLAAFDSPRANNAFAYVSPSYNGLNFLGMYVMDENSSQDNLGRDAFGVGVQYEPNNAPYRAGVTYIQAGDFKATRVSGSYDLTPATTVGALYQNTKDWIGFGGEKENAFTISAEHKVAQTPWTAYGQVDIVDNAKGFKDGEKQRLVLGSKYAFNQNTTGHIYGAYYKTEGVLEGNVTDVTFNKTNKNTTTVVTSNTKNKFDGVGIGAGIEYKF